MSFTNPAAGATLSGTATVTIAATGGSGAGYTYKLAVDGITVYAGATNTLSWNTTSVSNAAHTLTATVTDSLGQSGVASRSVTVSNLAVAPSPTVSFTAPAGGATVSGTATVTLAANGGSGTGYTYKLAVDGVVVYTGTSNTIAWNTVTATNGGACADGDGDGFQRQEWHCHAVADRFQAVPAAALSLAYHGKIRDRVGQGNAAVSADGAMDGTLTVTLNATGGRTITGLRLDSTGPGTWDTDGGNAFWVLAVAATVDGALINNWSSMAVNFTVANGGTFVLFASDVANIQFATGAR